MKLLFSILLVMIVDFNCMAQAFEIKEKLLSDTLHKKMPNDFEPASLNFFEDDTYTVRKTCSGEWGGTIWFKNKKTGVERSCSATCAVIINKLDGLYVVTGTLNHLRGFSQILEIADPEKLEIFKMPKPRRVAGRTIFRAVGDAESKSVKGSKVILDTVGISTILSFPFHGALYHIITDYKTTFVATIENKKFKVIDTISKRSFWSYNSEAFQTKNNHFIVFFKNEEVDGYVDVFDNNISVYRYR